MKNNKVNFEIFIDPKEFEENAYRGGILYNDKIFFLPYGQCNNNYWHFKTVYNYNDIELNLRNYSYNCINPVKYGYWGGVLYNDKIYLVPYNQGTKLYLHYIDPINYDVKTYLNNQMSTFVDQAYAGGVYDPYQNRIYFAPYNQAIHTVWHYINLETQEINCYQITNEFINDTKLVKNAYVGAIYVSSNNKIFFLPHGQCNQPYWHYINCEDGNLYSYENLLYSSMQKYSYMEGIYDINNNRILLTPYNQVNTYLHFIDCDNLSVEYYDSSINTYKNELYIGSYIKNNKVYFIPHNFLSNINHYVNLEDMSINTYSPNIYIRGNPKYAYRGGSVIDPLFSSGIQPNDFTIFKRYSYSTIFLIPTSSESNSFIIDTNRNKVINMYWNNDIKSDIVNDGYYGGCHYIKDKTYGYIFLSPYGQSDQNYFHYYDHQNDEIYKFPNNVKNELVKYAYIGAVYAPIVNRIYFIPYEQSNEAYWHYIDCNELDNIRLKTYNNMFINSIVNKAYNGGVYTPTLNRIYLVPYNQASQEFWHYIDCYTGNIVEYKVNKAPIYFKFRFGIYSPSLNIIYFLCDDRDNIYVFDCNNEEFYSKNNADGSGFGINRYNMGAIYCPTLNKIVRCAYKRSLVLGIDYNCSFSFIDENTNNPINRGLMGSNLFNRL